MALDDRTAQEQLTPDRRRGLLRAFADRMLLKATAMDDPEDMPGIERAVRTAAVIERIYSRCDRAEGQAPDPRKLEAERARHTVEAIEARVHLADTLKWGDKRRKDLGQWWDAAATPAKEQLPAIAATPAVPEATRETQAATHQKPIVANTAPGLPARAATLPGLPTKGPRVEHVDYTDTIRMARASLGLPELGLDSTPEAALPDKSPNSLPRTPP